MEDSLNRALDRARKVPLDPGQDRYVIISDQHLGDGGESDDFRGNRQTYVTALSHYYEARYRCVCIGDSEELWECDFPAIHRIYEEVYALERRFADEGRFLRLYGNHDIFWRNKTFLERYLHPVVPGTIVSEAVLLEAPEGRIFMTHGHQGELFSDALWPVSRLFVRYIWKPVQRLLGIKSTGAARNVRKRSEKEKAYYRWAREKKLLFIAGHTHRAMFASLSKLDRKRREIENLEKEAAALPRGSHRFEILAGDLDRRQAGLRAAIVKEFGEAAEPVFEPGGMASPCYFNDGCCCYDNGMTAIEIEEGMIRLVKWSGNGDRTVYEEESLQRLFAGITLL